MNATDVKIDKSISMKIKKKQSIMQDLKKSPMLYAMLLPGVVFMLIFSYLPMAGILIAFKDINYSKGLFMSDWIGFKNFGFLFGTPDAFIITRNTLIYNSIFIVLGLIVAVAFAIALNEITKKYLTKLY